jgi:hypothetical protein
MSTASVFPKCAPLTAVVLVGGPPEGVLVTVGDAVAATHGIDIRASVSKQLVKVIVFLRVLV